MYVFLYKSVAFCSCCEAVVASKTSGELPTAAHLMSVSSHLLQRFPHSLLLLPASVVPYSMSSPMLTLMEPAMKVLVEISSSFTDGFEYICFILAILFYSMIFLPFFM